MVNMYLQRHYNFIQILLQNDTRQLCELLSQAIMRVARTEFIHLSSASDLSFVIEINAKHDPDCARYVSLHRRLLY